MFSYSFGLFLSLNCTNELFSLCVSESCIFLCEKVEKCPLSHIAMEFSFLFSLKYYYFLSIFTCNSVGNFCNFGCPLSIKLWIFLF